MSHEVQTMAYMNATPWHGLGNHLTQKQPLEVWTKEAGFEWQVKRARVMFHPKAGLINPYDGQEVLYRSDNLNALAVVSERYKIVQPYEVLEFYRDLVDAGGFELETAGVLKGGKKVWALARTGVESAVTGDDRLKAYLLLATGYDGTSATTAQYTSIRVVCQNTLNMAVGDEKGQVRVPHNRNFDPKAVKQALGLGLSGWDTFIADIRRMASRRLETAQARQFLINLVGKPTEPPHQQPRAVEKILALFNGNAKGSELESANDTVWGLVNAVTEHFDHHTQSHSADSRLHSAWFGRGNLIKGKAFEEGLRLVA